MYPRIHTTMILSIYRTYLVRQRVSLINRLKRGKFSSHDVSVKRAIIVANLVSRLVVNFLTILYSIKFEWLIVHVARHAIFAREFLFYDNLQIYRYLHARVPLHDWRVEFQSSNMLKDLRSNSWVRVSVADLLPLATSPRERSTSTLSLRRPYLVVYMSPKIPAKVFRRFFMVSSVSSPWPVCDWLPCRWNGILDVGGSSGRRPTDGALLTVLDCEAANKIENRNY